MTRPRRQLLLLVLVLALAGCGGGAGAEVVAAEASACAAATATPGAGVSETARPNARPTADENEVQSQPVQTRDDREIASLTPEQAQLVQQLRSAERAARDGSERSDVDHHGGEPVPPGHVDEPAVRSAGQPVPAPVLSPSAPASDLVVGSEEHAAAALDIAQKALYAAQKAAEAAQAVKEAQTAASAVAGPPDAGGEAGSSAPSSAGAAGSSSSSKDEGLTDQPDAASAPGTVPEAEPSAAVQVQDIPAAPSPCSSTSTTTVPGAAPAGAAVTGTGH